MLLTNLRLVLPELVLERGALRIENGQIVEIVEGDAASRGQPMLNCGGLTALPGIIDMHGDMLERDLEPRPGTFFPTDMALHELDKRLAATGVTTAYAALSFWGMPDDDSARSERVVRDMITTTNRLRPSLLTDFFIHARCEVSTPHVIPVVTELLDAGQIHMLSLMDHTPGQGQYRNIERYVSSIAKWRRVDRAIIEAEVQERLRHAPDPAENWHLARDLVAMAVQRGLPIASHDDDTEAKVDLVASLGATMSEFPVTMEAANEARRRSMHVVMGAPNVLRGSSHSGNLSALEAIEAGVVDMLAADYYPAALLHSVFALVEKDILPLHTAAKLVSQNVAESLALNDRGSLAAGKSADLVLVETSGRARVRATFRRGHAIYADNMFTGRMVG
jgi:alpha-D-ribose 1-methylphosphonate 5-triphosphate diphosphatase